MHEQRPLEERSDESGGQALTHCADEQVALRHWPSTAQVADGEPTHCPRTNVSSGDVGHTQLLVAALHTEGASQEHEVAAGPRDVEPPPQGVQGAWPLLLKNVGSHVQAPVDGDGEEPVGHDATQLPPPDAAAQRPLTQSEPSAQVPPFRVLHADAAVVDVAFAGGLCPTGQEQRLEPASHVDAAEEPQVPQLAVEPPHPLGAAPH